MIVDHEQVKNRDHVLEKLKEVEELGGEGLMLRKPKSYVRSILRSEKILMKDTQPIRGFEIEYPFESQGKLTAAVVAKLRLTCSIFRRSMTPRLS